MRAIDATFYLRSITPRSAHPSLTSNCASKDYDGCDNADGLKRMRVTLFKKPLRPFDCAKKQIQRTLSPRRSKNFSFIELYPPPEDGA
jgi:hypothetical protein